MYPFAAERIQIGGQGCRQRFTFTGAHFSNSTIVQHHTAN